VDVLVPGQRAELFDARLDVVAGGPFPDGDARQVDVVEHPPVVLDHPVGNGHPEVALGLEHGQPEPALEADLLLGRPQRDELGRGVPAGQDIRNGHGTKDGTLRSAIQVRGGPSRSGRPVRSATRSR
jgi:hypothetical protein